MPLNAREEHPADRSGRRLRFDGQAPDRLDSDLFESDSDSESNSERPNGHRFVIAAGLVVLALWGMLYLVFRDWRAEYRERAAFGVRAVATAIDPLATTVPPDITPEDWRQVVAETRAMLVTLTSSNLLNLVQMRALRDDLARRVAAARPETARAVLAGIWDDMDRRARPILATRHPRPALLPPPSG